MELVELRDLEAARGYILQGLWLQRIVRPSAALVRPALEWALEIFSAGNPLPPIGFVADLGNVVYGLDRGGQTKEHVEVPGWPHTLARSYEDHVLGKIYADWTFERATDALRRYTGRDQAKGLAYVVKQIRERAKLGGVELPPAVLRTMIALPGEELLAEGYELLSRDGPLPLLLSQYESLVSAARRLAEVLGPEDVIALEQRTALADMGQYVAHRQILQTTARIESRLPVRPVRPLVGRKEVPTRVLDEDQYPVGGYSSISTKGSIESMLHSQLAYMEPAGDPGDLFDLKFVRDELFYYSRDENQFLRKRRTFYFVLYPDLVTARFKDPMLPAQRIVLVLSVVLTLVRKMTEWLSTDALRFEIVFVQKGTEKPLEHEAELLELLLREPIERGAAVVRWVDSHATVTAECTAHGRASQLHCLEIAAEPPPLDPPGVVVCSLAVDGPAPTLTDGHGIIADFPDDDAFEQWTEAVIRLLALWV